MNKKSDFYYLLVFLIPCILLGGKWGSPLDYIESKEGPKMLVIACGQAACLRGNDHSEAFTVDPDGGWDPDFKGTLEGFLDAYTKPLAGKFDAILIEYADPYPEWTKMERIFSDDDIYQKLYNLLGKEGILILQPNDATDIGVLSLASVRGERAKKELREKAEKAMLFASVARDYIDWINSVKRPGRLNAEVLRGFKDNGAIYVPFNSPEYHPSFLPDLLGLRGFSYGGKSALHEDIVNTIDTEVKELIGNNVSNDDNTYYFVKETGEKGQLVQKEAARSLLRGNLMKITQQYYLWSFHYNRQLNKAETKKLKAEYDEKLKVLDLIKVNLFRLFNGKPLKKAPGVK